MINITKDFDFNKLEDWFRDCSKNKILRLPSNIKYVGLFGVEVSLIQLALTWRRNQNSNILKTYLDSNSDSISQMKDKEEWANRLYFIAAVYLSDLIISNQDNAIDKEQFARDCIPFFKNMNNCKRSNSDSLKKTFPGIGASGIGLQLACFQKVTKDKSKGKGYEYLRSLYYSDDERDYINRKHFEELVNGFLGQHHRYNKLINRNQFIVDIARILFEAFSNTCKHACKNEFDDYYKTNIRGIQLKSHDLNPNHKHLEKMMHGNCPRFIDYVRHCSKKFKEQKGQQHFIEISIFDGGAGIPKIYKSNSTKKHLSDKEAIIEAFNLHKSTEAEDSRGNGLYNVWESLASREAFVRIRTGSVCLYQVFHDQKAGSEITFQEWPNLQKLAEVSGTVLTIIIPCFGISYKSDAENE